MLPPFAHEHDQNQHHIYVPMTHHNWQLYHQTQHMNPKMHYFTNQSFQNAPTADQRKNVIESAEADIVRLNRNSVASPNSSIFQNDCATTDGNNDALSQLNNNAKQQVRYKFNTTWMLSEYFLLT